MTYGSTPGSQGSREGSLHPASGTTSPTRPLSILEKYIHNYNDYRAKDAHLKCVLILKPVLFSRI